MEHGGGGSGDEDVEILMLTHFSKTPRLSFGTVRVGATKSCRIVIRNPHDYDQDVVVEKFPFKKNFAIDCCEEFTVAAGDDTTVRITWQPKQEGNCREMVQFMISDVYRLTAILFGAAEEPPKKKKRKQWGPKTGAKKPLAVVRPTNTPQKIQPQDVKPPAENKSVVSLAVKKIPLQPSNNLDVLSVTGAVNCATPTIGETVKKETEISNKSLTPVTAILPETVSTPSSMRRSRTYTKIHNNTSPCKFSRTISPADRSSKSPIGKITPEYRETISYRPSANQLKTDSASDKVHARSPVRLGPSPVPEESSILDDSMHSFCSRNTSSGSKQTVISPNSFLRDLEDSKAAISTVGNDGKVCRTPDNRKADGKENQRVDSGTITKKPKLSSAQKNAAASSQRAKTSEKSDRSVKSATVSKNSNFRSSPSKHHLSRNSPICNPTTETSTGGLSPAKIINKFLSPSKLVNESLELPATPENMIRRLTVVKSKPTVLKVDSHCRKLFNRNRNNNGVNPPESDPIPRIVVTSAKEESEEESAEESILAHQLDQTQDDQNSSVFHTGFFKHCNSELVDDEITDLTDRSGSAPTDRISGNALITKTADENSKKPPLSRSREIGRSIAMRSKHPSAPERKTRSCSLTGSGGDTNALHSKAAIKRGRSASGVGGKKPRTESSSSECAGKEANDGKRLTRTEKLRIAAAQKKSGNDKPTAAAASAAKTTTAPPVKPTLNTKLRTNSVKGVAQARLVLNRRSTMTALPKHPLPFAAKNMYYDERWMEKQERGFVCWMNFLLTPPEDNGKQKQKVDAGAISMDSSTRVADKIAPTRETLSFRAYAARRRLDKLRRQCCWLFQSSPIVRIIQKLESEIECGHLNIRKDRKLHADVGIKQKILDLILSYNPLWLRIGMETIYGELLLLSSSSDVVGLSRYILTRLLSNPDIAQEYAHPTVPHLFKPGYDDALAKFTLKKYLMLVLFLDKAKSARLITHDPCLFCKDSPIKSSRDLLIQFARDYLSGEGDITKHLGYLGYAVDHVQTALDEYDYGSTNLAVDLRDGLRLTRITELLTQDWSLSVGLRVPAISRLQKVHNVEVALKKLVSIGLDVECVQGGKITPKDIVDGQRQKTLALMWKLIFNYQVNVLVDEEQLKDEIHFLKQNLNLQRELEAFNNDEDTALGLPRSRQSCNADDLYFKSPCLSLLLKWCQVVCSYYAMKVENFTVSFSDGRALCCIIHHYHPGLLPLTDIKMETTQTLSGDKHDDSDASGDDDHATGRPKIYHELLANEKINFKLVHEKVSELGGIPLMVKSIDMSNTIPDEKVVITYVSFLCARLMDIRSECRAARVIQAAWRKYRLTKLVAHKNVKLTAVRVIQKHVRLFLTRRKRLIKEKKTRAVVILQAYVRRFLSQRRVAREHRAATIIQSAFRTYRCRSRYVGILRAVRTIQRKFRATKLMLNARSEFVGKRTVAVVIQRNIRRYLLAKRNHRESEAALTIQSAWRMCVCRRRYQRLKSSARFVQTFYRGRLATLRDRYSYLQRRGAAVYIQRAFRSYLGYKNRIRIRAAVAIQSWWRGELVRLEVARMTVATGIIRERYRGHVLTKLCRMRFLQLRIASTVIQTAYRTSRQRREYQRLRASVIRIQASWRGYRERERYRRVTRACRLIQSRFRVYRTMSRQRDEFRRVRSAAVVVQKNLRAMLYRRRYSRMVRAAVAIQTSFRAYVHRRRFLSLRCAASIAQSVYRRGRLAKRTREEFARMKSAAVSIQSYVRMVNDRRRFVTTKRAVLTVETAYIAYRLRIQRSEAASTIQKFYRSYKLGSAVREMYLRRKESACIIQQVFRSFLRKKQERRERAATTIQSYFRMTRCRLRFLEQKRAAVVLQSFYRTYARRNEYRRLLRATRIIQSRYRHFKLAQSTRREFVRVKSAAVVVQTLVRMRLAQRQFALWRQSAVLIQRSFRAYKLRKQFIAMKRAALVIERAYSNYRARKDARHAFARRRDAVVRIQAIVRGRATRQRYAKLKNAVIRAQAIWRGRKVRCELLRLTMAVITIQRSYRRMIRRRLDEADRRRQDGAAVIIQSAWRRYSQRRNYEQKKLNAIAIQSAWRMFSARREFARRKWAAITIQKTYRGYSRRVEFLVRKGACIAIQAVVRGWLARLRYRRQQLAAMCVQSCVRAFLLRRRFVRQKQAAITIQRFYRATKAARSIRADYLKRRDSIVCIQAFYRMFAARECYLRLRRAAIVIQSSRRQICCARRFERIRRAAVTIQKFYRRYRVARGEREELARVIRSCIAIQSAFRRWSCRRRFLERRSATVTIQACVRGRFIRCRFLRLKNAAIVIQRRFRARREVRCQRGQFEALRAVVLIIQRRYRSRVETRNAVVRLTAMTHAAVRIQSAYRGYLVRRVQARRISAALTIQSYWRMRVIKLRFTRTRRAVIEIQRRWRACVLARRVRYEYLVMLGALITVQSHVRGTLARKRYDLKKMRVAAIAIQKRWRSHRETRMIRAAVRIQSWFRMRRARSAYASTIRAITRIQAIVRGAIARERFANIRQERILEIQRRNEKRKVAAVIIQRFVREWIKKREAIKIQDDAARIIQRWTRAKLTQKRYRTKRSAAVIIQRHVREWIQRHQAVKIRDKASRIIQAFWRGHSIRRNVKNKKIINARKRISDANRNVTDSKRLCNRTTYGLDCLLKCRQLSLILEAVMNLEIASRYSWTCCERMVGGNAVHVLFTLIHNCNRSVPHMEIIKYIISILINLAKCKRTQRYVYESSNSLSILVELLQHYLGKGIVFTKTCTLIAILAQDEDRAKHMAADKANMDKIVSIQNITERKNQLREKYQKQKNSNVDLLATKLHKKPVFHPEWVIKRNSIKEMEDPVMAIQVVAAALHLKPKSKK
ncbi:uncharacterized protein LOC141909201 [Tubulanus polymorphus]|uniref:uncharacterized protein LOC141909201 n=1 Tax=Tubulanus polymorphus TaxID=672921 RepID=UPI003DA3E134